MRIYVAGPYCPYDGDIHDAARLAHRNTLAAIRAGLALIKKGHVPFIPHLTHFVHLESEIALDREFWKQFDMNWLQQCEGLLFLASSPGADAEKAEAKRLGLLVWDAIDNVPDENAAKEIPETVEELYKALQPLMVLYYDNETEMHRRRLAYANERLLGVPEQHGPPIVTYWTTNHGYEEISNTAPIHQEATGLHKYGGKHLTDREWCAAEYCRQEVTDAITQLGPLLEHRRAMGREKQWTPEARQLRVGILGDLLEVLCSIEKLVELTSPDEKEVKE